MNQLNFILNLKNVTLSRIFPLLISITVILFIYKYLYNVESQNFFSLLNKINIVVFILSIFTFCVAHYFSSKKYTLITNMYLNPLKEIKVGYINYFSALFANVVPFGPSADLCRITLLKTNHKIQISNAIMISILDRCSTIIYTTIIGISLLLIQTNSLVDFNKIKVLLLFWVCMIFIIFLIIFVPKFIIFKIYKDIGETHDNFKKNIWLICFDKRIILLTFTHMFFISISILLCAHSVIGYQLNFNFILLSPFFQIIQSVPLFFGGWGVRESAFLYFIPEVGDILSYNKIFIISILVGISVLLSTLPSLFFLKK